MADIYEQHRAAFSRVSAFVIRDSSGERVATVALKFPADGAGRLYAYVHLIGVEMVRSFASGYGYDKRSAAVASAIERIPAMHDPDDVRGDYLASFNANRSAMRAAAATMGGDDWTRAIERAGFRVLQAV